MKQVSVRILEGPDVADVLMRGGEGRIATLVGAAVDVTRKVYGVLKVVVSDHSTTHGVTADVTLSDAAEEGGLHRAMDTLTPQGKVLHEGFLPEDDAAACVS